MDAVKKLLEKLNYEVSPQLQKMINSYNTLGEKLEKAEGIFEKDPTQENKEALEEIQEYFQEYEQELIEELEEAVEQKEATPPADTPPADTPPADTPPASTPPAEEKKEGSGATVALIVGIGLLVVSLGAINILKK